MLGDALAHDGHGLNFVMAEIHFLAGDGIFEHGRASGTTCGRRSGSTRRSGGSSGSGRSSATFGGSQNVVFADASAGAGAGNLREVNILFAGNTAHQRRASNFFSTHRRRSRPL